MHCTDSAAAAHYMTGAIPDETLRLGTFALTPPNDRILAHEPDLLSSDAGGGHLLGGAVALRLVRNLLLGPPLWCRPASDAVGVVA